MSRPRWHDRKVLSRGVRTCDQEPSPQCTLGSMAARPVFVAIDPNFRWGHGSWFCVEGLVACGETAMNWRSHVPSRLWRWDKHRALSPRSGIPSLQRWTNTEPSAREAASHRFSGGQTQSPQPAKRHPIALAGDKLTSPQPAKRHPIASAGDKQKSPNPAQALR